MKKIVMLLCLVLLVLSAAAGLCLASEKTKPVIVTTIYPLYDFTKQVVGANADVVLLVPAGAEPHDWEPSPADLVAIAQCDIFIYNGANMESWVDKVLKTTLSGKKIVNASRAVQVQAAAYDEDGGVAEKGALDPHIWLDPVNAIGIVDAIGNAVAKFDEANEAFYKNNTTAYKSKLSTLNQHYIEGLQGRKTDEIITSHAAFGYMAKRYGFKQTAIMGLTPESEPTPDKMVAIIDHVRNKKIKYIFFETLVNPKLSEVIATDTGAQTLVFNPLEGLTDAEIAQGQDYITVMEMNLVNLRYALGAIQ